jgi:cell division protein FtsW (lipid II flippase)
VAVLARVRPPAKDSAAHAPHARRRTELGLLILSSLIVAALYLVAAVGTTSKIPPHLGWFLGIVLGLGLCAHLGNRFYAPDANPVLLPIVTLLNGLGYVMIARIGSPTAPASRQAAWTAIGVGAYLLTLLVVRRSRDLDRYRYLLLLFAVVLMLLPLVPHVGRNINGARLWIYIGPLNGQPVELAKLALCIFFASYFTERRELLSVPTYRIGDRLVLDPRPLVPILVAWGFAMLVLGAERDIGFALLIFVLFIAMLWLATGRALWLALGLVLFAAGAVISSHLFSQVQSRVTAWLHPWQHTQHSAYQLVQGLYGMGLGGLTGTGLGFGYLHQSGQLPSFPFPYSDYIFASFGEEMGLLGTSLIVFAFLLLVGNGLRIAQQARSEFSQLAAAGLTLILGMQAFFIMAGIVQLLPLTGITLPFMAYGGSSIIANYILIALLMRISDEGGRPAIASQATATPLQG